MIIKRYSATLSNGQRVIVWANAPWEVRARVLRVRGLRATRVGKLPPINVGAGAMLSTIDNGGVFDDEGTNNGRDLLDVAKGGRQ